MTDAAPRLRLEWARRRVAGDTALAVVDSLIEPGSIVVDAGAERGLFTARLADLVGPDGTVHAVEPNPDFLLEEVSRSEPNVRLHRVALSDGPGRAVLHVPRRAGRPTGALGSLSPLPDSDELEVELVALDDLLVGPLAFMKIDVEGHELAVLRGARETLARDRPTLLIEIERRHAGDRMDATFALLDELRYRGEAIGRNGRFPLADFDEARDQLAFLGRESPTGEMPAGYVHDFLFTPGDI